MCTLAEAKKETISCQLAVLQYNGRDRFLESMNLFV